MKKSSFILVTISLVLVALTFSLASCLTHQVRKATVEAFAEAAAEMGEVAVSHGDRYVVAFSPIKKIRANEEFEFVTTETECYSRSIGVIWEYAVDHKIYLNGKTGEDAKGVTVKMNVEIRQKSTGKTLDAFEIEEDLSEPCGMMLMGKSEGDYKGRREFDEGDYEFVITDFQAKRGKKFTSVPESAYVVGVLR